MAEETVLIHHRGMPADPPVVNGITFAPHPDDPTLYVGEASVEVAQGLCVPGSPFQAASELPPVVVVTDPVAPDAPPSVPEAPVASDTPPATPDAPVVPAVSDEASAAPPAPDEAPSVPAVDPDLPTTGPGITEPVVPDNVIPAKPVPSAQDDGALDPTVLLALREEQATLQALEARTPEDEARLQAISDELAFAGFHQ